VFNATFSYIVIKYFIWILTPLSVISWWRKPDKLISKMRCLDWHYLILYIEEFENTKEQITAKRTTTYTVSKRLHIKVQSMSPKRTNDFTLRYRRYTTPCVSPTGTKDFTLKYRVWAPQGQAEQRNEKVNTMATSSLKQWRAWSKAYENCSSSHTHLPQSSSSNSR
jgi:hypothetical protein